MISLVILFSYGDVDGAGRVILFSYGDFVLSSSMYQFCVLLYHEEFRLRSVSVSSGPGGTEGTGLDPKGTENEGIPRNSEGICTLV